MSCKTCVYYDEANKTEFGIMCNGYGSKTKYPAPDFSCDKYKSNWNTLLDENRLCILCKYNGIPIEGGRRCEQPESRRRYVESDDLICQYFEKFDGRVSCSTCKHHSGMVEYFGEACGLLRGTNTHVSRHSAPCKFYEGGKQK